MERSSDGRIVEAGVEAARGGVGGVLRAVDCVLGGVEVAVLQGDGSVVRGVGVAVVAEKPLLGVCEVEIMESLLRAQRPERVLEWGAGWSTVYWPGRCGGLGEWVAIEHERRWYERIKGRVLECVDLRLVERADYYVPLLQERKRFDLIIVDGVYRRACLLVAETLLWHGGIVVLHDAGRLEYRASWGVFPHHELLYRGRFPYGGPGEYLGFGLCVFWGEWDVNRENWCRDHIV